MRSRSLMMIVLAVVFGVAAVLAAHKWLDRQAASQRRNFASTTAPVAAPTETIVVAATALRYGAELGARELRAIPWPGDALPPGAFRTVEEALAGPGRRVVLTAIEENEPVLRSKLTGPGQRASLSTLIEDGMGAVTIHVNEVIGVAGFVLPGDRVDVLLTRQAAANDGGAVIGHKSAFTDVVLQNVRVLAVGQLADERTDKPAVVNAVTIEVGPVAAQKIALASSAGSLSLMLRKAGEVASTASRRVSLAEIGQEIAVARGPSRTVVVHVARGGERKEYTVLSDAVAPAAAPAIAPQPVKPPPVLRAGMTAAATAAIASP